MRKIKKKFGIPHKVIVFMLIFCMVFENGAMYVSASGQESGMAGNEDISSNTDDVNPDDEPEVNAPADAADDSSGDNSGSDSDANSDGGIDSDSEEKGDSDSEEDSDNDTDQDKESADNPDSDENIENTDDGLSDYAANDTIDTEYEITAIRQAYANAEDAFAKILSGKDVMALVYLTDVYHVRSLADSKSSIVADLESGHTVYLLGVTITQNAVWYKVQFWVNGSSTEGYIERGNLAYSDEDWIKWDEEYLYKLADNGQISYAAIGGIQTLAASYADVAQFPAGYQAALTSLKSAHPNWTFVPMNTKLDFETSVSSEMGDKSLIQNTESNASKGWVGAACPTESGWYYANRDAVSYYMDPRNFLTETYIFQFEQLTFNSSYHTVDAIQNFLNSTFMKGTLSDDDKKRTYAQAFYEIGSARKLSPIHLASRVYLEQGQGNSGLISGTYPGYEGYYNYFNVGVNGGSDTEKIVKGLTYAKNQGWNTRYKSLEGGAATIGNNYILKGQDTIYLEKFNVDSNSPYGLYQHQYMQNIQAPASESSSTRKMYAGTNSLNSAFVFKIPVYNNMPGLKLDKTKAQLNKGETLTLTASVNGTKLDSKDVKWTSSDTSIVTVVSGTVTAMETGTAAVTASYDGNDAVCTITVVNHLRQITLNKESLILRRPDTVVEDTSHLSKEERQYNVSSDTLRVIFDPEDTTDDKTIVWTSSNKKVATVNEGVVTAIGAGETTITAKASKAGNKTAQCKVTVIAPVYKIEFSSENNTDTILAGQSINLSAEYFPKDTTSDTTVLWTSSDMRVATVARTRGTVRGISAGKADITATIGGYSASHKITVEACTVTFMDADNKTILETISAAYGDVVSQEQIPDVSDIHYENDLVFIGWYTGIDGTGSRFDYGAPIHQKETILYPCFKTAGGGFYVIPVGDQTYTGSAIKPEVLVYDSISYDNSENSKDGKNAIELVPNKDYTVSYKNNKNAASADSSKPPTIIVKGKGNYTGTQSITFNIITKALTDTDITADNLTVAYTGKTIKSSPILYRNGKKLSKNKDYKITYPQTGAGAYSNAGTYPIIVTGTGGYHSTLTVYETISDKILLSKVNIARIPNQTYDPEIINERNGVGIEPPITVTYKNKPLTASTDGGATGDYVVTYKNNFKTGTATATITAADNDDTPYTGSKSINFKITAVPISKAAVTGVVPKTYTGIEKDVMQDNISVTIDGELLTPAPSETSSNNGDNSGDYIIEYKNINKAGTATMIIKGINKYTGTKKVTYKITACDLSQIDESDLSISYCMENTDENDDENIHSVNSLNDIVTPYVKGGSKPTVMLSYKGTKLVYGKDYTVKYKNNNAITTAAIAENKLPVITITGKGLFKGQMSGKFRITGGQMSDNNGKITMTARDVVFKAQKGIYKTSVVLTDTNGKKLQSGKDYEKDLRYTYVNDTEVTTVQGESLTRNADEEVNENDIPCVGTAIRVTVTGTGAYAGDNDATAGNDSYAGDGYIFASKSVIYHIVAADISKAKVIVADKTYNNGEVVTLTKDDITVTLNGKELIYGEDKDYVIENDTYVRNCDKGKASVTIRGTGTDYGGTKKINFTIKGKTLSWP
ncbi:MAG: Ig-like domain-containing protein [Lachnospiraceae bacterium]|nr:Ig-like domain-containing protein [Lachnospiraceae bacterium]